ncbi:MULTISPECIES: hypothetical protein [unclassified Nocardioides]|uniref:hypothetical protein n=1 Tax=unclassified Nocardioides TaxID=2615069 RepID=UPI0030145340
MQRDEDEDAVWRSIVDNYGDRPDLEPEAATADPEPVDPPLDEPVDDPEWFSAPLAAPDEDRFVPPPPPPVPRARLDRRIAWFGVFGAPVILLVCLIIRIGIPRLLAYGLVAAFVGGFLYLVWQMPRGPRDPWDDGAQV